MIDALLLAVRQLTDRRILQLLAKVLLLSLALFVVFGVGAYFLLVWLFAWASWDSSGFAAAALAALIAIFTGIFLFRLIAMFVLNIFSDEVVDAVEAMHYPERAATAQPPSLATGIKMGLASVGRAVAYNLLAAPLYILLLVTGVGAPIAFFAVNAILIGRDLQDMVSARHIALPGQIDPAWHIGKSRRFGLGLITALLLAVPFVNFLAPVLGAAMATHLVHRHRNVHRHDGALSSEQNS